MNQNDPVMPPVFTADSPSHFSARLAAIVNSSFDAIISKTLDGAITTWNPAATHLFGYSAEEMLGQPIRRLIPLDRQDEEDHILRRIRSGERVEPFETVRLHKSGAPIEVSVTISPVRDEGGRIIGASKIIRDVTELKRQKERVQLLLREVNHRSKNLLTLVQAVARRTIATDPGDFLNRFEERIQSLAASQDLLVKNEWKGIDLNQLVRFQLDHFKDLIGSRIEIKGPALFISASAAQALGMALHELATNAGKYGALSSHAGRVEVFWDLSHKANEAAFVMSWREAGGPPVGTPVRCGFGSTVICGLTESSLNGTVELNYDIAGVFWRLMCPAEAVVDAAQPPKVT